MLSPKSRMTIGRWLLGKLVDSSPEFKKSLQLLPWLPFAFTFSAVLVVSLVVQVIGYGLFYSNAVVTYGKLMEMLLTAFGMALLIGFVARLKAKKEIDGKFGLN